MNDYQSAIDKLRAQLVADAARAAQEVRIVVRTSAMVWFFAAVFISILLLLVCDCVLRREEVGLRWLWPSVAIIAIGIASWKLLLPAMRFRCNPIHLARWLDRQRADTEQRLTTALELAKTPAQDSKFGSEAFRELAFVERMEATELPSLKGVVRWTQVHRALVVFCGTLTLAALFFVAWPEQSWHALRRLLMPWSAEHWPKKDDLAFVDLPTMVGQETMLQVEIVDHMPPLPKDVRLEVRQAREDAAIRVFPVRIDSDVAVASLPNFQTDIQIRATGGDDHSMIWHDIRVVANPQWKNYYFEITLPDYLRSSPEAMKLLTSDDSKASGTYKLTGQQVAVPIGSKVQFIGELDRPVISIDVAQLPALQQTSFPLGNFKAGQPPEQSSVGGASAPETDLNTSWSATLDDSGTRARLASITGAPLTINQPVRWHFKFEIDHDSFLDSPGAWAIAPTPDRPPEVVLAVPSIASVAMNVPLPIVGTARDDWGLRDVKVKLCLESHPEVPLEMLIQLPDSECERSINTLWDYSIELQKLGIPPRPQDQLMVWLEASDHLGQLGKSQVERWSIERPERQLELLAQRQNSIADQLQQLLEMQTSSQQLSREVFERLSQAPIQQSIVDTASAIEQLQMTIDDQIANARDSIRLQMEQTLELLHQNGFDESEHSRNIRELLEIVSSEISKHTANARDSSHALRSHLQSTLGTSKDCKDWQSTWLALNEAQTNTLRSLRAVVEQLDKKRAADLLRQELLSMASQQEQISKATQQTHLDQLQAGQQESQVQFEELAKQQLELARQLEHWLQKSQQLDEAPVRTDSTLRSQLNQANQLLIQSQTATTMSEAGRRIQLGQLGNAVTSQQAVDRSFGEAVGQFAEKDSLSQELNNTSDQDMQGLQLSDLKQSIASFIERQQSIVQEFSDLGKLEQGSASYDELRNLSARSVEKQELLRDALQTVRDRSNQLPIFQWALDQAAFDMSRAAAMARRKRFDPDAVSSAHDALNKLSAIKSSLEPSNSVGDSADSPGQKLGENDSPTAGEASSVAIPLASLKLIRSLQLDLAAQTQALEQITDPARQSVRRSDLASQQRELADRLQLLLDEIQAQPADHSPGSLNSFQDVKP